SPPVADLVCRMVMPNYIPKAFGISPFLLDYYILRVGITYCIDMIKDADGRFKHLKWDKTFD
ncbi:MAG: hypothetical protein SGJ10_11470, partial [Bacteroidota bacterium]|nr:hypothetical protein [Bacteroidota bacterium]